MLPRDEEGEGTTSGCEIPPDSSRPDSGESKKIVAVGNCLYEVRIEGKVAGSTWSILSIVKPVVSSQPVK